jgi:uncharacterized protein
MKDNANIDLLQGALMNDVGMCSDALDAGAQINVQDSNGDTALHIAASWGHAKLTRFLLEHSASILVLNNFLMTPLHIAAINGQSQTLTMLLEWARSTGEKIPSRIVEEVAYLCSESGMDDAGARALLESALSEKEGKRERGTARLNNDLIGASSVGDWEASKKAIEEGASPDALDDESTSALRLASRNGHTNIVRLLIERGAQVNKKSKTGWTALMEASAEGYLEIVDLLLLNGAFVDAKTYVNGTSLIFAARGGYAAVVKTLLAHGADPTTMIKSPASDAGKDAIKVAIENDHEDVALLIRDYKREE